MLPPDYLINQADSITAMYADLQTDILVAVATHIKDTLKAVGEAEIIPSAAYQVERLNQAGMLREEIVRRLTAMTSMSNTEIAELFEAAAIKTLQYDARVYEAAGLIPIQIPQSPEMLRILDAGITKTLGSVERLTGTIAINAEERFEELVNLGYNKVVSGAFSHQQATADAVDDLARAGIKAFDYASGRSISIEAAVRMNVLTGANQTAAEITVQGMTELGATHVRVSAHLGARNTGEGFVNHEGWQGKIHHWREMEPRLGAVSEYPDFLTETGYGDVRGLCGANCRHSFGPYFPGLSLETYTQADLDEWANKTVTYTDWRDGEEKTIPYYDGTQVLRGIEGHVRDWKRREAINKAADVDSSAERIKVRQWQKRARAFTEQTGIKRDYNRERIAGEK